MRRAIEAAVLTAGLFLLWLVLISSVTAAEVIAGIVCAAVAAALHLTGRRVLEVGAAQAAPWGLRWLPAIAVSVLGDTARMCVLLFRLLVLRRPISGEYRWVGLGDGDETRVGGAALAVSLGPGSIVVDTDAEGRRMLVHAITPASPVERAVSG